jgi:hypothetical protein
MPLTACCNIPDRLLLCSWLVQASLLGAWIYCMPGPKRRRLDAGAGCLDDAAMSRLDAGAGCLDGLPGCLRGPPGTFGSYLSGARRSLGVLCFSVDLESVIDCEWLLGVSVFDLRCDSMESRTTANVSMYACRHE